MANGLDGRRGIGSAEYGGAGDEHGCACGGDLLGIPRPDASVHLDEGINAMLAAHRGQAAELVERAGDELLASEPGVHTHEEDHVEVVEDVFKNRDGRGGIEHDARLAATILNVTDGAMKMG